MQSGAQTKDCWGSASSLLPPIPVLPPTQVPPAITLIRTPGKGMVRGADSFLLATSDLWTGVSSVRVQESEWQWVSEVTFSLAGVWSRWTAPLLVLVSPEKVCISGECWRRLRFSQASPPRICLHRDPFLSSTVSVRARALWSLVMLLQGNMCGGDYFKKERQVLKALPSHSGESMTMLQFPWQPGDCKLTFGPGNSLQFLGTTAKLLLIMKRKRENTKGEEKTSCRFRQRLSYPFWAARKVRKKPHSKDTKGPAEPTAKRGEDGQATIRFRCSTLDSNSQHLLLGYLLLFIPREKAFIQCG